jgi:hypothetical protein
MDFGIKEQSKKANSNNMKFDKNKKGIEKNWSTDAARVKGIETEIVTHVLNLHQKSCPNNIYIDIKNNSNKRKRELK